jgi:hypothetical protein
MDERASLADISFAENGQLDVVQLNALYRLMDGIATIDEPRLKQSKCCEAAITILLRTRVKVCW